MTTTNYPMKGNLSLWGVCVGAYKKGSKIILFNVVILVWTCLEVKEKKVGFTGDIIYHHTDFWRGRGYDGENRRKTRSDYALQIKGWRRLYYSYKNIGGTCCELAVSPQNPEVWKPMYWHMRQFSERTPALWKEPFRLGRLTKENCLYKSWSAFLSMLNVHWTHQLAILCERDELLCTFRDRRPRDTARE